MFSEKLVPEGGGGGGGCFYRTGLCSVSYIADEYSIYHFCIMIKDLIHFFFKNDN